MCSDDLNQSADDDGLTDSYRRRSVALLLSDVLRFTPDPTLEQVALVSEILRRLAYEEPLGAEEEEGFFQRLLDADFQVTAPFDPEKWAQIINPMS